ncbi:serine/threonine-protein kinase [Pseudanabaena biceps]|nr:serine/threonine-protein kinase [Pseudanabaena biceps]ELS34016.1 serine/threonine protein kinase [Pseudanabaena biceps PCC 7429]
MLGKTLTGRYKIVKMLGGGGFSQTFIAEDGYLPDRPACVIKQLKPASSQAEILKISRELFDKEAKVLYRLGKHDCIPSLLAHFEEDEEFFLAQELIEGDVLTQEIKRGQCLGEQYTIDFLTDILPTLDFVHQQQVIHRDLKPSNLIRRTSDKKIVLIDFGAVKEVSTQPISQLGNTNTSSLVIGSPGYMPNEQYSGKTMYASDIYAIGMIALQALTGLSPNQIPEDPITSEFCWRDLAKVTPTLAEVLDKMVRFDFRQRYQSASEVLDALQPLLTRSLAHTILSVVAPSVDAPPNPIPANTIKSPIDKLIDDVSDDLEMCEDPVRAKKLVCLVCTGILENDLNRLNNFSFGELLQDIYQQYPTIELLKENLVKAVKTIDVQKQRQYLIVAKIVFNAASQMYQKPAVAIAEPVASPPSILPSPPSRPEVYSVNHLVINADSAQLIAPIDNSFNSLEPATIESATIEPAAVNVTSMQMSSELGIVGHEIAAIDPYAYDESDVYAWVAHDIDTDTQQMRLKKLLFYTYQDVWESDLRQLNSINWTNLLRELVSFVPTFAQLTALIQGAVQRVSKPTEYLAIGNLLLIKLEPLYPDRADVNHGCALPIETTSNSPQKAIHPELPTELPMDLQSPRKIPFNPQIASDLFDLRLELMRFTSSMRAKILLFSVLYYPFDPDRDNWQDLRSHGLDGLLRQFFYAYASFDRAEKSIWQTARSLSEPNAYDQSASYILQAVSSLYDLLEVKSMQHPAEGRQSPSDDTDFTQPSLIFRSSDDDDTCQFI